MKILINPEWLAACGMADLAGVPLEATVNERNSWSAMGAQYDVTLPDGAAWTVFHCRGVTQHVELPADMTDGEKAYALECIADGASVADAIDAARDAQRRADLAAMQSAYARGKAMAENMLQPGTVFMGSANIADSLGYARESVEWRAASLAASVAIAAYGEIWIDQKTGRLANRIKLSRWGHGGQSQ